MGESRAAHWRLWLSWRQALRWRLASSGWMEKPTVGRVDNHEAVAAIRRVDASSVPWPATSSLASSLSAKDGTLRTVMGLCLAGLAMRRHRDQAAGGFEVEAGFRLRHLDQAGVQQYSCHADGVRAGHGRGMFRLHDDEAELRVRVFGRHQQVDVPENPRRVARSGPGFAASDLQQ